MTTLTGGIRAFPVGVGAIVDRLVDAVVDDLNAAAWSAPITAQAAYVPLTRLHELGAGRRLYVLPAKRSTTTASRGTYEDEREIFVALQEKTDPDDRDEMRDANSLAEELYDHLTGRDMTVAGRRFAWQEIGTITGADAGYAPEHLDALQVFSCILRVRYLA